jgi:FtsP/CotA-like multicopper oxidase with cupredoxin domain
MNIKVSSKLEKLAEISARNRREIVEAKLSRREMMKLGLLTSAGLLAPIPGLSTRAMAAGLQPTSPVTVPFVDPLPIPPVAEAIDPNQSGYFQKYPCEAYHHQGNVLSDFAPVKYYHHRYTESQHQFHRDLPSNAVWGWEGLFGGPTLHARYGEPIMVRRTNMLNPNHVGFGNPAVSTHTHNAHTPSESDGYPEYHLFPGEYKDYHYPNAYAGFSNGTDYSPVTGMPWEAQSTLWYHDHMLDFTSQNVYKGLAGFHLMFNEYDSGDETDPNPKAFRLPSGEFDIPLMFLDAVFTPAGEHYMDLFALDGVLGDKFMVNGKIQPYHQVARRKYRLRLLNAGPSRHYNYKFSNNMPFHIVAIDGNLLPKPLKVTTIQLSPAQRADIIVDFSKIRLHRSVYLLNNMEQVNGRGPTGKILRKPVQLIRFDAIRNVASDPSQIPAQMYDLPSIPVDKRNQGVNLNVRADRTFRFDRSQGAWTVNGAIFDPTVASAVLEPGAEEVWEIQGSGNWFHPVHVHFEEFQILSRNGLRPAPFDAGRRDVIWLKPGERVRMFMRFRDFEGRYVMHCHNVVHEDHAMMVRWDLGNPDPCGNPAGCSMDPADYSAVCDGSLA